MTTSLLAIVVVNITNVLGALGTYYLKKASDSIKKISLKSVITNKPLIMGVILYGIATMLFIPALRYGELSVLYSFVAVSYIWGIFLSIKFLKEKMNGFKWIGVVLIVIGVIFMGLGSG